MNQSPRLLTRAAAEEIINRIRQYLPASDEGTTMAVTSWWDGELRWARNRTSLASDRRDVQVSIGRRVDGGWGTSSTNQFDDVSLEATVRAAERGAFLLLQRTWPGMPVPEPVLPDPTPVIWSDATYNVTAEERGRLARHLAEAAEAKNLMSSGYLEMRAGAYATFSTDPLTPGTIRYETYSQSQCSVSVRHPQGIGSGWAGLSSYDWASIDSVALARTALDKCVASLNPVGIEPGRYTVVLEPQAVSTLTDVLLDWLNMRSAAEQGQGPFALEPDSSLDLWRTKLDLQVVDERLTFSHDPADPLLGLLREPGMKPITWIDRGVLTSLSYGRPYALTSLNDNLGENPRVGYRMSGGTVPVEEMIRTTKRGLLVTRLSSIFALDARSLLITGVTRDGVWLIENGTISKAVKNLRFTESPLFALNRIEQLGVPVPVFRPVENPYNPGLSPAIVPALKANDFSFTSTIDAV